MAETVASALLGVLIKKLADEAFKKVARSQKIHSELNELQSTLSQIEALLNDASAKEITNESVGLWLKSLQHLAYDIDDVLDDVATEAMRRELGRESVDFTSKVRNAIPTCCTNLSLSQSLTDKLDSITMKLQQLEKQKSNLGLVVKDEKQKINNRGNETSLLESDVVGRQGEKENLMKKLLGGESSKENFSIVPIVGMGGVGKTTLARLLYNDQQVKGHFKLMVWVCVSDDFGIFKISATILQSVTGENKNFNDLNQLQTALIEQFNGALFLLVLDDVWTENYDDWEKLVRPFRSCAPGSRIIVTTRKEQLLKSIGFDHLDHMESLSDRDALSLLSLHALGVDNFDSHPTLRSKGEGIVAKCGGLPLALKAIGRLLRTKTDEEDWGNVLNNKIWELKDCNDIVPALRLSYHDLPAHLKQLFAYCSLFPKDFLFDKEELILLWMAEGYLNQSQQSPEHLGRECFEKLLSRSFFQYAPNDRSFYVMHDLMNDLATFVAREYFLRFDQQIEMVEGDLAKYRHMSFIRETYVGYQKFEPFEKARSLRTLLAVFVGVEQSWQDFYLSNKFLDNLFPRLTLLRVLSLRRFRISEVPDFIGNFKHLRYLNLSQTKIIELPENVGNLYNLQTLILFGCTWLTKLPKSFVKLKKLRHFDIRDTPLLKKLSVGIGELRSLHTFTKIIIGGEDGFAINELKGLSNLHGELSIEGLHNVQSVMHVQEAKLSQKRLTKLELKWGDDSQRETLEMEVLNELKPHTDMLKYFNVEFYKGIEFPGWVGDSSFQHLVGVSMRNCRKCKFLPPLGQLPSLKKLFIQGMEEVKVIGSELTRTTNVVAFPSLEVLRLKDMKGWEVWSTNSEILKGAFPRLRELYITNCPKLREVSLNTLPSLEVLRLEDMTGWEVWSTNSEILKGVFPCLRELYIENCPKLREVSLNTLPSLRILKIDRCGSGVLRSLVCAASAITNLKIRSISELTDEVWRGAIKDLGAVEEVDIIRCNDIRHLWESEAHVNIKKLCVDHCENLVSLGEKEDDEDNIGNNFLSSLKILIVGWCKSMKRCTLNGNSIEKLDIFKCESLTCVSFIGQKLKSLEISGCSNLMEKINNTSMSMLEDVRINGWTNLKSLNQLSNSINLTRMDIWDCPSIESVPDIQLPNLTLLSIRNCENLKSFPDLQLQLPNLTDLDILSCPSIDASSFPCGHWPPNLRTLDIWGLKKPISEWGFQNFPTSLVELCLCNEPDVRNFSQLSHLLPSSLKTLQITKFDKLESLSVGLQHLTSLQHLHIAYCPKMKRLPETLLPSLLSLNMDECPILSKRCNGRGSRYWPLISHIPCISID